MQDQTICESLVDREFNLISTKQAETLVLGGKILSLALVDRVISTPGLRKGNASLRFIDFENLLSGGMTSKNYLELLLAPSPDPANAQVLVPGVLDSILIKDLVEPAKKIWEESRRVRLFYPFCSGNHWSMGMAEFFGNKLELSHFDSVLDSGHESLVYRNMTAFYKLAEVPKEDVTFLLVRYPTQPSNSVDCAFYTLLNMTKVESRDIEPEYEDDDVKNFRKSFVLKVIEKVKAEFMFSDTPERLRCKSPNKLAIPSPLIENDPHELR